MAYTLNEYYQLTFSNPNAPRIVVYPNNSVAASLLNYHKSSGTAVITLADCFPACADNLPMPNDVISVLNRKIRASRERVAVIAIDSYLSLLSESNVKAFWVALRGILDRAEENAVFVACDQNYPDLQFPPQYLESKKILKIIGDFEVLEPPKITVVSDKWVKVGDSADYKSLLERLGSFLPTGEHTLVLNDLHTGQAGLSNAVSFLLDVQQVAERFYGVSTDLKTSTLESLLTKASEEGLSPEKYLETRFGVANIDTRLALKRLHEMPDEDIWSAYVWLLRKRLPADTYLVKALSVDVTHDNLLRKYAVDTAISVLNDSNAEKFADERASAIAGMPVEPLIIEFLGQTKEVSSAVNFLNCGTAAERIELVRRVSKLDLTMGLPEPFRHLFPALADYLSVFDYGSSGFTDYFKEYRIFKVNNIITAEFVNKAYSLILPATLSTRESLLSGLRTDDTALLIVDGMGAEYLPLLLAMAKRRNINLESFAIASVKLPTSTEFNHINWDKGRTLDDVKGIDNIAHYGAAKHESCPPERNIEAVLRVFETEVCNRIAAGLNQFSRVVVTADHGASRLAVLAHNGNFGTTLPWSGQPDDWRYSVAPVGITRPSEYEQQYSPEDEKTYWVVRGYNRLPKSGGKPNELHGGASLEERLVPVVVFTRNASVLLPEQLSKKHGDGIVDELEGFI